jgi:hypothetical protein
MSKHLTHALMAAAAAGLVLAGCATSGTPYQPASAGRSAGGYSEVRIAPDRYRVTFAGNTFTSRDTVEGYLLYRAAELTVDQGNDWFRIVDREMEREVRSEVTPDPFYRPWYGPGYVYWRPDWRYYRRSPGWSAWYPYAGDPFWATHVDVRQVERFEVTAEIVMGRGAAPSDDGRAFEAREIMARLGPTIRRPGG